MEAVAEAVRDCRRGIERHAEGDLDGAIAAFSRAIDVAPEYAEAWNNRAAARLARGDRAGALADLDRALGLRPDYAEAANNRGFVRQASGDLAGAIADFDRALAARPRYAEALHNRAVARRASGDPAGAVADLDRAIGIRPDELGLYHTRAGVLHDLGEYAGAVADYDRVLASPPAAASPSLYIARAAARARLNDWTAALRDLDRALELDPGSCTARISRANVRYHLRDLSGYEDYLAAFRIDAAFAAADLARLLARDVADDPAGVLENCRKHVRIGPGDLVAYARRGLTLLLMGRDAEAQADFEEVFRRSPEPDWARYLDLVIAQARRQRSPTP